MTANSAVTGLSSQTKERLCLQILSFRFLEALLSATVLISLALTTRHHHGRYIWPASIWSHALALKLSPAIYKFLHGTDNPSKKDLKVVLMERSRSSRHADQSHSSSTPSLYISIEPLESSHMWQPFARSCWFQSVTTAAPVKVFITG